MIEDVKNLLMEIGSGLSVGVSIEPVCDRSGLILRAIDNLKRTLKEESLIVALVCVVFLFHLRSDLVGIITLPIGVFISFLIMKWQGINADIMSLGGIAIAVGAMVDAAIVMIENLHKHMKHEKGRKDHLQLSLILEETNTAYESLILAQTTLLIDVNHLQ